MRPLGFAILPYVKGEFERGSSGNFSLDLAAFRPVRTLVHIFKKPTDRTTIYPVQDWRSSTKSATMTTSTTKLPQEAFLGVMAFNFAQRRHQRKDTAPSRLLAVDKKKIVIPPNSYTFSDWKRTLHVPWIKTH